MGRYNEFRVPTTCPHCAVKQNVLLQADIGRLERHRFDVGADITRVPVLSKGAPIEPAGRIPGKDFWGIGLGTCLNCKKDLYARIIIKNEIYESVEFLRDTPDDLSAWGYLRDLPES